MILYLEYLGKRPNFSPHRTFLGYYILFSDMYRCYIYTRNDIILSYFTNDLSLLCYIFQTPLLYLFC